VREIKLRAWDKKEKKMHYGNMEMFDDMIGFRFGHFGVDTSKEDIELMQSTRLKDKNGCEIYEGDIFKTRNGVVAVVEWDENNGRFLGFTLERERKIVYVGQEPAVEVICNIYENPELLKGCNYE
jgi:uncharacterized phage protein (TIGR01671 family)